MHKDQSHVLLAPKKLLIRGSPVSRANVGMRFRQTLHAVRDEIGPR